MCSWKLSPIIGASEADTKAREDDYKREVISKKALFDSRPDMANDVMMGYENLPETF